MMLVNSSNVVSGENESRRHDFPSANMLQIKNQKEVPIVFALNLINLSVKTQECYFLYETLLFCQITQI